MQLRTERVPKTKDDAKKKFEVHSATPTAMVVNVISHCRLSGSPVLL
jgi:hypothetical protein